VAKRNADFYRRGVNWFKIKNRTYSQADNGRGELLNGHERAVRLRMTAGMGARLRLRRKVGRCGQRPSVL
jgi:hypothetical protein